MGINDLLKPAEQEYQDTPPPKPPGGVNDLLEPAGVGFEAAMDLSSFMQSSPELRADVARKKESLLIKGLRFVGSLLEPALLPGDALRAVIYDTFYRQPDEESALGQVWKNILTYAPWGEQPEEVASFRDVLRDKYGVEGATASVLGTALDIVLDPTVLVAGWGKAANIAARSAAKEAINLGIDVSRMRAADLARVIERMEPGPIKEQLEVAYKIKRKPELLTPAGFVEAAVPETVRSSLQKAVIDYADNLPYLKRIRQRKIVSEESVSEKPGKLVEEAVEEPLAKSVLPDSTYWALKTTGTPHEEAARAIHGVYDVFSPGRPDLKVGLKNEAEFLAKRIRSIGEFATVDLHNTIRKTFGRDPKEIPHFYAEFDRALGQLIDKLGPGDAAKLAIALRDAHSLDEVMNLLPKYKLGNDKLFKDTLERLRKLARAYNLPENKVDEALENGLRIAWSAHAIMGYYLSGMHKLDEVINELTPEIEKIAKRHNVWFDYAGAKKPDKEALLSFAYQSIFDSARGKELSPAQVELINTLKQEWSKRKLDEIFAVSFEDYIKSLDSGYLRRIVPLKSRSEEEFVESVMDAMERGVRWFKAKNLEASELVDKVRQRLGNEAADKLEAHLAVRGDGAINTLELAEITGSNPETITRILSELDVAPIDIDDKVLDAINKVYDDSRRAVAKMEIGFQKWQERKLPEWKLVSDFLVLPGLKSALPPTPARLPARSKPSTSSTAPTTSYQSTGSFSTIRATCALLRAESW